MEVQIPNKLYFRIGEVSRITRVKPYVLRYWESEFKIIKPQKSMSNQRVYKRSDVEVILEIKRLLHKERYTLEGAKKKIKEIIKEMKDRQMTLELAEKTGRQYLDVLGNIRNELVSIRGMLG
ncbi:MAG: hypothetical protein A2073_06835 [Deltaproteobacteria bacterium GWC2_42_11]|nr:MAG: hypothetical protein A2073_06835 [Deltaproteobacteria bacterium GWC2_42_11]HBO85209.1 MerR family transcriptional regulator [Deltaproteobacteria bacterium]